jgi:hypothetical protein
MFLTGIGTATPALLRVLPALLTQAARTTGKVTPICSPSF